MKTVWSFTLSNLDALLAVAISMVVAVLGPFGLSPTVFFSAMTGVLALLAFGLIRDRIARDDIGEQLAKLRGESCVSEILNDREAYSPLTETINSAQLLCFVGPSLINIFSGYAGYFQYTKLGQHGASIQAIVLDPKSPVIAASAQCLNEGIDNLRTDIESTCLRVRSMIQEGINKGSIELRLIQASPNYSMVLIDPDKEHGKMFIEFIGYKSRLHERPHIELNRTSDREWFEYFFAQYNALCRDAKKATM